ncbi:hypothetical protein QP379_09360, partial [Lactobacillus gasseri]|nr:hypothetical protein [Lactobacillus gasseri]
KTMGFPIVSKPTTELSLTTTAQINDIETANDYLLNTFVPDFNENNNLVCFNNHTKCLVIEAFDKQRFITVDAEIYFMREIP